MKYFYYKINNFSKPSHFQIKFNYFFSTETYSYSFISRKFSSAKSIFTNHTVLYPTPANISYFWNFGFLSAFCLGIQVVTGIFLAMHYNSSVDLAFSSVEHIMRDVNGGWFIRYAHANGASFFFGVVYIHIFRALFFKSYIYSNKNVWLSGIFIFILMMATAFIGYVLPWGQMSFWGATVITNLFSVVPVVGVDLVYWIWGGFSVGSATLNRFFSLHYFLPFIIIALVIVHLFYLHNEGSSNPFPFENRDISTFYFPLYPYFIIKDLYGFFIFTGIFSIFIFYMPNLLGHPDNYIEANALVTPEHIVPEWYFLPFYAILRSVPDKTIGIVAMAFSLIALIQLPFDQWSTRINFFQIYKSYFVTSEKPFNDSSFIFIHQIIVCIFGAIFIILGFIGSRPVEEPYTFIGFICMVFYFGIIFGINFLYIDISPIPFKENKKIIFDFKKVK